MDAQTQAPVKKSPVVNKKKCRICQKDVGRGIYSHEIACSIRASDSCGFSDNATKKWVRFLIMKSATDLIKKGTVADRIFKDIMTNPSERDVEILSSVKEAI